MRLLRQAYFPLPSHGSSPYGLSCGCIGTTPFLFAASDDGQLLYVRPAAGAGAGAAYGAERYEACLLPLPGLPLGASIVSVAVVPALPARSDDGSCLIAVAIALPEPGDTNGAGGSSGGTRDSGAADAQQSSGAAAVPLSTRPRSASDGAGGGRVDAGMLHLYHVGALLRGGIVGVEATPVGSAPRVSPIVRGVSSAAAGDCGGGAGAGARPWHESVGFDWFGNALGFGSALLQNHPLPYAPLALAVVRPVARFDSGSTSRGERAKPGGARGAAAAHAGARGDLGFASWYARADARLEARFDYDAVPPALLLCGADRTVHAYTYDSFEVFDGDGSVSFLLCTVTFHANRAHNLTRSP